MLHRLFKISKLYENGDYLFFGDPEVLMSINTIELKISIAFPKIR